MRNCTIIFALMVGLLVGCSSEESDQKATENTVEDPLTLHVVSNNQVVFEDQKMSIVEFKDTLASIKFSPDVVFQFSVDLVGENITTATVTDIQRLVRKKEGVLRINYVASK